MHTLQANRVISVIIADDHLLFADGLCLLLQEKHFNVVAVASTGRELMDILGKQGCDIILLDINMPQLNGFEALRFIRQQDSNTKVIMLSTYNEIHMVTKAIQQGANGYVVKNFGRDELIKVICQVLKGEDYFPLNPRRSHEGFDQEDAFLSQFNLTNREKEIISLIKQDYTSKQISAKLFLSIYTVDTHRKNIMQKLKLKSTGALMRFILEYNL